MRDLELFLVGLVMASTVYPSMEEDPTADFGMWVEAWVPARILFDVESAAIGWLDAGPDIEGGYGWNYRRAWPC